MISSQMDAGILHHYEPSLSPGSRRLRTMESAAAWGGVAGAKDATK